MYLVKNNKQPYWKHFQLFFILTNLLLANLYVPKISTLCVPIIFALGAISFVFDKHPIIKIRKSSKSTRLFLTALILITFFSFIYFETVHSYNFIDDTSSLIYMIAVPLSYFVGYSLDYVRLPYWPKNLMFISLFLICGGVAFVFLSIIQLNNASFTDFIIQNRRVPSFWGLNSEAINGPTLDLYNILGISLVSILLFGWSKKSDISHKLVFVLALSTFLMSLYSSISLLGRTPIIALIISGTTSTIFIINKAHFKNKFILILVLILATLIFISSYEQLFPQISNYFLENNLLTRFEKMGLESGRYELWRTVLTNMFRYPFGERKILLPSGDNYAHNLWLDVAYDAGIIPMFLLIWFHVLHIHPFYKVLSAELPKLLLILLISLGVAFIIGFIGTPVIQGSRYYFATSCFFLGLVAKLASDLDSLSTKKGDVRSKILKQ